MFFLFQGASNTFLLLVISAKGIDIRSTAYQAGVYRTDQSRCDSNTVSGLFVICLYIFANGANQSMTNVLGSFYLKFVV